LTKPTTMLLSVTVTRVPGRKSWLFAKIWIKNMLVFLQLV